MITKSRRIQVNDEAALQGFVGILDFAGGGVSAVVSGNTATITITGSAGALNLNQLAPSSDQTITAGYSAYVVDYYELVAGIATEIGVGSVLEIG